MKIEIAADLISMVIRLAWVDRSNVEEIQERTGLAQQRPGNPWAAGETASSPDTSRIQEGEGDSAPPEPASSPVFCRSDDDFRSLSYA
jgi:hypothetical protein